jgi:hypothetical protein
VRRATACLPCTQLQVAPSCLRTAQQRGGARAQGSTWRSCRWTPPACLVDELSLQSGSVPPPSCSAAGGPRAGHHLAQLPVDAKIGKLLLLGASLGCLGPCLTVGACLSYRGPFAGGFEQQDAAARAKAALAAPGAP